MLLVNMSQVIVGVVEGCATRFNILLIWNIFIFVNEQEIQYLLPHHITENYAYVNGATLLRMSNHQWVWPSLTQLRFRCT